VEGLTRRRTGEEERVSRLGEQLLAYAGRGLRLMDRELAERARRLEGLGPQATLRRGYSICLKGDTGAIVRRSENARVGAEVRLLLGAGELGCRVEEVKE
jgi:exodeoxyribonuclease VII large subunit